MLELKVSKTGETFGLSVLALLAALFLTAHSLPASCHLAGTYWARAVGLCGERHNDDDTGNAVLVDRVRDPKPYTLHPEPDDAAGSVVLVERVRELLARLLKQLAQLIALEHRRIPFVLHMERRARQTRERT